MTRAPFKSILQISSVIERLVLLAIELQVINEYVQVPNTRNIKD